MLATSQTVLKLAMKIAFFKSRGGIIKVFNILVSYMYVRADLDSTFTTLSHATYLYDKPMTEIVLCKFNLQCGFKDSNFLLQAVLRSAETLF